MKTAKQDVVVEHCSRDGDCRNCPGLRDKEFCEIWPWKKEKKQDSAEDSEKEQKEQ